MKIRYIIGIVIILSIGGVFVFTSKMNFSSIIQNHGFKENEVLVEEEYSTDSKHSTTVLLAANRKKIALLGLEDNFFGYNVNKNLLSIKTDPTPKDLVVISLPIMKTSNGESFTEKHIFLAAYVNKKINRSPAQTDEFQVTTSYFDINNQILMYVHALAGKNKKSFGSDDVLSYLQSEHYFD
ncbi:hypothetical protein PAECIP111893_04767 [Paenibacillus plantiphilus]|uniref:Uncharacterized protein n=1 Tax=Paenibacillus plantiphilus TaxID=2905650 RepID=A0ABM9CT00_9BACL|nr:hypothetical protein [Paenibacillus plantiphilus]CAH1221759.1 hypothetical protein PAECIP111893_04767 [Paenibacillus plantiphilus]